MRANAPHSIGPHMHARTHARTHARKHTPPPPTHTHTHTYALSHTRQQRAWKTAGVSRSSPKAPAAAKFRNSFSVHRALTVPFLDGELPVRPEVDTPPKSFSGDRMLLVARLTRRCGVERTSRYTREHPVPSQNPFPQSFRGTSSGRARGRGGAASCRYTYPAGALARGSYVTAGEFKPQSAAGNGRHVKVIFLKTGLEARFREPRSRRRATASTA
jgi:hypothetical protein